jgi:hypothetical protein
MRKVFGPLVYRRRRRRLAGSRYRHLIETIHRQRCRTLVEIGTYDGQHARYMIETAALFHDVKQVEYYGFDLFERLTPGDLDKEFSKEPPPVGEVTRRLRKTGAQFRLFVGYTSETLPTFVKELKRERKKIDFVFIDGGHSVETIASDWGHVSEIMTLGTIVLFDDYYTNTEPEVARLGCQHIIASLDRRKYDVEVLEPENAFEKDWGTLRVRMAQVRLRAM